MKRVWERQRDKKPQYLTHVDVTAEVALAQFRAGIEHITWRNPFFVGLYHDLIVSGLNLNVCFEWNRIGATKKTLRVQWTEEIRKTFAHLAWVQVPPERSASSRWVWHSWTPIEIWIDQKAPREKNHLCTMMYRLDTASPRQWLIF